MASFEREVEDGPIVHFPPEPLLPWQIRALELIKASLKSRYAWLAARDFPILPMDVDKEEFIKYLGFAILDHQNGAFVCDRIEIKCHCALKAGERKELELIRLIPTFLHELAHVLRESKRNITEFDVRKKKLKRMNKNDHFAHDDEFYQDLKNIYKDAEDMGIYELPNMFANKFSKRSLQRFDDVDLFECSLDLCGRSQLYPESIKFQFEGDTRVDQESGAMENQSSDGNTESSQNLRKEFLRATVFSSASGPRKPIILQERSLQALLSQSGQKLKMKKALAAYTAKGERITDQNISTLRNDELIRITTE